MKKLVNEALEITKELGDMIFIGALAVYVHTKNARDSQDIDFVVENLISDEELIVKGYKKSMTGKQPWFTPRGLKIDIFTGDIPGVKFGDIVKHAKNFSIGNKGSIRVIGLECLIAAKHEAERPQDVEDLENIAHRKINEIDWGIMQQITNDEFKTNKIRKDMEFLSKQ